MKDESYELAILVSPASEQDWSEQLCNFPYWEKTLISREYEPHQSPIAEPAYTYIKIDPAARTDTPTASFETIESLLSLIYKPFEIELADPKITIKINNEEKLPVWLCAKLPKGIYVGVAVAVSTFD